MKMIIGELNFVFSWLFIRINRLHLTANDYITGANKIVTCIKKKTKTEQKKSHLHYTHAYKRACTLVASLENATKDGSIFIGCGSAARMKLGDGTP